MARQPRPQFPGAIYHVTARGAAGRAIFADEADRKTFPKLLGHVVFRHTWRCIAYCVMTTHYHLLLTTPHADLAAGMRFLNTAFARRFNKRHGGSGAVFEARYHSELIERDSHLLEVCRYLALNPVRAGLIVRPEDWTWGSYAACAAGTGRLPFVSEQDLLGLFAAEPSEARRRLRAFVEDAMGSAVSDTGQASAQQSEHHSGV
jgi:putative transposase